MFSYLQGLIDSVINIKDNITSSVGTRELELRFTLPKWLDKSKLLTMYKFNVEYYKEDIYTTNDINKSKIRARYYNNDKKELISKHTISKRRDNILDINVVLSQESNIYMLPKYSPYKTINCTRYYAYIGALMIDIKVVDDTQRLEIEILNNNYVNNLREVMLYISYILYKSDGIISPRIYKVLSKYYENNICRPTLPRHINYKILGKLVGPWMITYKLDGERRYLCVTSYGIYSINRAKNIYVVSDVFMDIIYQSILDCEYYDGNYYIIDVLMSKSEILVEYNLIIRLCSVSKLYHILPSNILNKDYYTCNCDRFLSMITTAKNSTIYDGLILVRADKEYRYIQYKIKKLSTCDMVFDGYNLLSSDNFKYNIYGANNLNISSIYECYYDYNVDSWKVIKHRIDKDTANHSDVINASFESLTLDNIEDFKHLIMSSYHNKIKDIILSTHLDNGILLDIGSGRGGDISKWKYYRKVYCIEPNITAIEELYRRLYDDNVNNVVVINTTLSDYNNISNKIIEKVTNVTMFFSLMMMTDDDMLSLYNILINKCTHDCSLDIITMSKDLVQPLIGGSYIKSLSNDMISVTIPDTYIIDNTEYLVDVADLVVNIISRGFSTWITKILDCHFAIISDETSKLCRSYVYIAFNRGNCRNSNITNITELYDKIIMSRLLNNNYIISYRPSEHNIESNNNKYYVTDLEYFTLL